MLSKIFQFVKKYQEEIILFIGVILVSLFSFAMGYILAKRQDATPIKFEHFKNEKTENSYYRSGDMRTLFGVETFRKRAFGKYF